MEFSIRRTDAESRDDAVAGENRYRKHLERFRSQQTSDLGRFFFGDFFHDGAIDGATLSADGTTLILTVNAPNIERRVESEERGFEYVNVMFDCVFDGLRYFTVEAVSPGDRDGLEGALFLYAEANAPSLEARTAAGAQDGECSFLRIQALGEDDAIWAELAFESVAVNAHEPEAFSVMLASPEYDVGLYQP